MVPGVEVVDDRAGVIGLLKSRRNPRGLPPLEVLRQARPVGREGADFTLPPDSKGQGGEERCVMPLLL